MRYYKINGKCYPSVTSVIKPYKDNLYGKTIDPAFLKKRADIGTETHNLIEKLLSGQKPKIDLTTESGRYASQLWPLISTYRVRAFERAVYSDLGFAGRFDLLVWDDELGCYVMTDIKTTCSKRPDLVGYAMQVSAYGYAFRERSGVSVCHGRLLVANTSSVTVYDLNQDTMDYNFSRFKTYLDMVDFGTIP